MSIWVYTPSQAKYRPIFSPKYFLQLGRSRTQTSLTSFCSSGQTCATSPPGSDGGHRFSRPRSRNSGGGRSEPRPSGLGVPSAFPTPAPSLPCPGEGRRLPSATPRPGGRRLHCESRPAKNRRELQLGKPGASYRTRSWRPDEPRLMLTGCTLVCTSPQGPHSYSGQPPLPLGQRSSGERTGLGGSFLFLSAQQGTEHHPSPCRVKWALK